MKRKREVSVELTKLTDVGEKVCLPLDVCFTALDDAK